MSEMEKITGNSPEAKSLDITQQNIEQLRQLFPDVFSENKIDVHALTAQLIESGGEVISPEEERYNFTWNGKTKARQIAQTPSIGTLRPSKEESVNWDKTENLFIEGDNLEVLKLLQKSYHKKVKMIYIDPPYNTGRDFIYKDNFQDNIKNYLEISGQADLSGNKLSTNSDTSGRYHSNWLSMMYPRLKLARNLLKDDGVIFISIDDSEYSNVKSICDEIFGEENFIEPFVWIKKTAPNNVVIGGVHEYILVYAKNQSEVNLNLLPRDIEKDKKYKNPDNDPRGRWAPDNLTAAAKGGRATPSLIYEIVNPITEQKHMPPEGRMWIVPEDQMLDKIKDGSIYWGKKGDGRPMDKKFLKDIRNGVSASTLLNDVGSNSTASKDLASLFDGNVFFETPKPVKMLQRFVQLGLNDGDLALDFFAGSATLAEAIYRQNMEDNKARKYILCQLPEEYPVDSKAFKSGFKKISTFAIERIKRAEAKLNMKESYGFKVFQLDETNIKPWDANFDNLEQVLQQATESIKSDRSSEDVLYEILLKYGIELTVQVETEIVNGKEVFVVGAGALIVCLDDGITSEVVEGIAKLKDKLDPETTQVVFKDAGFADSNVKTNAIQILKQAGIDDVKSI